MSVRVRNIVFVVCGVLSLAALALYAATGAKAFTRYPSEAIGQANESEDLSNLFAETGLNDESGERERVENEFTFGLLPAGPGADAISVATVIGPAAAVAGLAWFFQRKQANQNKAPAVVSSDAGEPQEASS